MNLTVLLFRTLIALLTFALPIHAVAEVVELTADVEPPQARESSLSGGEARRVQIGVIRPLPQQVKSEHWVVLEDGGHRWSATIRSPGAKGIRLGLIVPELPRGAVISVSEDINGKRHAYLKEDLPAGKLFWSHTLAADEVQVDAYLPPEVDPRGVTLQVAQVGHIYRTPRDAGSCNIDVTCHPEWAEQAASAVKLSIPASDGFYFCSGVLLGSSESANRTPYILTANHCVENGDEADGIEFIWGNRTAQCNGEPDPGTRTLGAALRLSNARLDSSLLEPRVAPPEGAAYAEWSTEPVLVGDSVTAVHFPDGSHMRISFGQVTSDIPGIIEVVWSEGTTEPGSSGSPLFDRQGRMIGHLLGGYASCSQPDEFDHYRDFSIVHDLIQTLLEPGRDLHGGSVESATTIELNGRVGGRINEAGDLDYFRIDVSERGVLTLQTEGDSDTFGRLYDDRRNLLAQNDDAGDATNFHIRHTVGPGSYYVRVSHRDAVSGSGDYVLTAAFDRHADDGAAALTVGIPSRTAGSLFPEGDNDYFRIEVSESTLLTIYTEGGTDTFGYLLDADGNEIARNDDGPNGIGPFQITQQLEPGSYLIRVRHFDRDNGWGDYQLVVEVGSGDTPTDDPIDEPVDDPDAQPDPHGDDIAGAAPLPLDTALEAAIHPGGDIDVFRIELTEAGVLSVATTGSTDTVGRLLDDQGFVVLENDDQGNTNLNFGIEQQLEAGIYFIEVRHYDEEDGTGSYEIEAEFSAGGVLPTDDHGSLPATATLLNLGSSVEGVLDGNGDRDLFRLEIPWSGLVTIASSGSIDTTATLLDVNGDLIAMSDDEGVGLNFLFERELEPGTYFVAVEGYLPDTQGAYTVSANLPVESATFDWRDGRFSLPLVAVSGVSGESRWMEVELAWTGGEGAQAPFELRQWRWVDDPSALPVGVYHPAGRLLELPSVNVVGLFGNELHYRLTLEMVGESPEIRFDVQRAVILQ